MIPGYVDSPDCTVVTAAAATTTAAKWHPDDPSCKISLFTDPYKVSL